MKDPIRIAITGAAGQIGYALLFRIASGEVFGKDQPIALNLIEIPAALDALKGAIMELDDCAFPLLSEVVATADMDIGFKDADWTLLVGSVPRKKGMERSDLLSSNAKIFSDQGKALARVAKPTVKTLVVGNPCNTNAYIAMKNAAGIPDSQFFAMTRLDENRAKTQLAQKAGVPVSAVTRLCIWGNHSATQYPDFYNAHINGESAAQVIDDEAWLKDTFIPTVQKRGAAIIEARGASSAASAANAILDAVRSLSTPTPVGDWHSVGVISDGSYGTEPGIIVSLPIQTQADLSWSVAEGLDINAFSREKIDASVAELKDEANTVADLVKA